MTNNDILRRLRYTLDYNDAKMMTVFELGGHTVVTRAMVSDWLKQEDEPTYSELSDSELCVFLNGLITEKRGKKEGVEPKVEKYLSNNEILKKLKIALNLQTGDIIAIFGLANKKISEHEVTAFFRNAKQPQYRPLNDQFLRNFLTGLQQKNRPKA